MKDNEGFFVPIDIEQRKIQKKERFNKIVNNIQVELNNLKETKTDDPKEQLFIDLFKNLIIKVDYNRYPRNVFLFDEKSRWLGDYYFKTNDFWCSYKYIWSIFGERFGMDYAEINLFLNNQIEKYFNIKSVRALMLPDQFSFIKL